MAKLTKAQAQSAAAARYYAAYKQIKTAECVDQNGEGSEYNLNTGQCEGP